MPDSGYYKERPRPEAVRRFVNYLSANKVVEDVVKEDDQLYTIKRTNKSDVQVYLTNLYIVGTSDLYSIRAAHPEVNAIVTMSAWNGYSSDAKESGKRLGVGIFTFKEFLGAIYYDRDRFLDYTPPVKDGK